LSLFRLVTVCDRCHAQHHSHERTAKASTTAGVALTSQYSRTDGFTYSMTVASGQRRRMRLFQTSRYFVVSKRAFNTHTCTWYSPYSGKAANAPQKAMDEEWLLQA